ncbi:MAG: methyltransferase domain-containing protein [Ottowia sp.]|nr:methyltransferase domain-containing protein [Ottowia sp.]
MSAELHEWLAGAAGQRLLEFERAQCEEYLAGAFGYHALQLGLPMLDALATSPVRHHWLADAALPQAEHPARLALLALPQALPFAESSLDLVVLPHTLELCGDAHATLREVQRVLAPEGKVAITGINPWGVWGWRQQRVRLWRRMGLQPAPWLPPETKLIAHWRLCDWLRLLGFEVDAVRFGCGLPALGQRFAPALGAVYFIFATRRVYGVRPLRSGWRRTRAAPLGATVPSAASSSGAPQKVPADE